MTKHKIYLESIFKFFCNVHSCLEVSHFCPLYPQRCSNVLCKQLQFYETVLIGPDAVLAPHPDVGRGQPPGAAIGGISFVESRQVGRFAAAGRRRRRGSCLAGPGGQRGCPSGHSTCRARRSAAWRGAGWKGPIMPPHSTRRAQDTMLATALSRCGCWTC